VNSKSILTQMMQDLRMTSKISQYFPSQEVQLNIVPG
jgi:hypothetical protein